MKTIDKKWVEEHTDIHGVVVIPEGIECIETKVFENNEKVKKIIMPNSVTNIQKEAFVECSNLEEIKISNNVITIGEDAFYGCKNISIIKLPKTLEFLGDGAFAKCEQLANVIIESGAKIKELNEYVFAECTSLKNINIPDSIEAIKEGSFMGCTNLEEVSIPNSVEEIGSNTFSYCTKLKNVKFESECQLKKIDEKAFYLCKELQKIKLPSGLKTIEESAFAGCYNLFSVDFGEEIETIGMDAFNGCKSLKTITLPDSLKKISEASFIDCSNLTRVNGGNNVEELLSGAFKNTNIDTFKIPSQVKNIVYQTVGNCTNLKELYLGENTEALYPLALEGCTNLKKISLNDKLSYFAETALEGVDNLEEVEINGTSRINYGSFKGKTSIRKITIDGNEYLLSENEELFSIQKNGLKAAIVVTDKDGLKRTKCINLEKNIEKKVNGNVYLANDGTPIRSINNTSEMSIEQLERLKQFGEQKIYIYGSARDLKPKEHDAGIEYDLYSIDELIEIKKIIQEIKQKITIPSKEDKHREKKIYSQLVRTLSEYIKYDHFEAINNKKDEEKNNYKEKYEKIEGEKWEVYWEENKGRDIEKTTLESGNLKGLLSGKAVCRGNAEIIRNITAECGIEAIGIMGNSHMWNQVKLDGVWYDDDFTNYQSYLARGDLEKSVKRFLCGEIEGKSEFSNIKMYSRTYNRPKSVGKSYSLADKKFLLNYGVKEKIINENELMKNHSKVGLKEVEEITKNVRLTEMVSVANNLEEKVKYKEISDNENKII